MNHQPLTKNQMTSPDFQNVAIIVAHPDDETLWAAGTILNNPQWRVFIACLSRSSDAERSARFYNAIRILGAEGQMADLDDGPEQDPLPEELIELEILKLLAHLQFDLVITHDPGGEYTRHLRHEEISKAVINLWNSEKITSNELWTFAYEDQHKKRLPEAIDEASYFQNLNKETWQKKYELITETYKFPKDSWEAKTTPKAEAFWQFRKPEEAMIWLNKHETPKGNNMSAHIFSTSLHPPIFY